MTQEAKMAESEFCHYYRKTEVVWNLSQHAQDEHRKEHRFQ